jgi:hypothetical protein
VAPAEGAQQRCGVRKLAGVGRVAGRHERLVHARRVQAGDDLVEVRGVAHEPRRQVRHDLVALGREALGDRQRGLQAARGRRGHRHLHLMRHVGDDLLLDPLDGEDLVADHATCAPSWR